MDDVHCDEEDTATTRGRTPAHEVCHFQKTLHDKFKHVNKIFLHQFIVLLKKPFICVALCSYVVDICIRLLLSVAACL